MEEILYIITRAFAIGLLISAPMGPIGILCIHRTLSRGRQAGMYTGLGASLSDFFYCLLTGLGMSFVTDFIETNRNILQIIGSAVLLAYAIYLIRNKNTGPTEEERRKRREKKEKENKGIKKKNKWNDFLTGFLLTLSNPLIVFLIIGLFARFNFFLPEYQIHHYIIGYIFIVAGAICWWMIITRFVDKVRNKFSNETIRKLNIMIGLIILIMSAVGIFTGLVDYLTLPQVGKII